MYYVSNHHDSNRLAFFLQGTHRDELTVVKIYGFPHREHGFFEQSLQYPVRFSRICFTHVLHFM